MGGLAKWDNGQITLFGKHGIEKKTVNRPDDLAELSFSGSSGADLGFNESRIGMSGRGTIRSGQRYSRREYLFGCRGQGGEPVDRQPE